MNRLKDVRKKSNLTQKEVGEIIGVSQNTYSYWENGKVKIDNESLQKLSDLFNVSVDYLLGRSESPAPQTFYKVSAADGKGYEIPQELIAELLVDFDEKKNDKLKLEIIDLIRDYDYTLEQLNMIKIYINALKLYYSNKK